MIVQRSMFNLEHGARKTISVIVALKTVRKIRLFERTSDEDTRIRPHRVRGD